MIELLSQRALSEEEEKLMSQLDRIFKACGEVCETHLARKSKREGYYDSLDKAVDCRKLFATKDVDHSGLHATPPKFVTISRTIKLDWLPILILIRSRLFF